MTYYLIILAEYMLIYLSSGGSGLPQKWRMEDVELFYLTSLLISDALELITSLRPTLQSCTVPPDSLKDTTSHTHPHAQHSFTAISGSVSCSRMLYLEGPHDRTNNLHTLKRQPTDKENQYLPWLRAVL